MSAPLHTLEQVAQLLPEDRRERFYALMATLQNAPEDDEYLLILEAIGFMTLIWQEVPEQVRATIASATRPGSHSDSASYLVTELRHAVKEALDVPSYSDMRQLAAKWDEQHGIFKAAANRLTDELVHASAGAPCSVRSRCGTAVAFVLGIGLGVIGTSMFGFTMSPAPPSIGDLSISSWLFA